jgi:hypothetical protein
VSRYKFSFDEAFFHYGDSFTRLLFEAALAEGCTIASISSIYSGTNWGTVGDV